MTSFMKCIASATSWSPIDIHGLHHCSQPDRCTLRKAFPSLESPQLSWHKCLCRTNLHLRCAAPSYAPVLVQSRRGSVTRSVLSKDAAYFPRSPLMESKYINHGCHLLCVTGGAPPNAQTFVFSYCHQCARPTLPVHLTAIRHPPTLPASTIITLCICPYNLQVLAHAAQHQPWRSPYHWKLVDGNDRSNQVGGLALCQV